MILEVFVLLRVKTMVRPATCASCEEHAIMQSIRAVHPELQAGWLEQKAYPSLGTRYFLPLVALRELGDLVDQLRSADK